MNCNALISSLVMGPQAARSMVFMPAVRVDTDWNSEAITLPGTEPAHAGRIVPLHQRDERRAAEPQGSPEKDSTTLVPLAHLHPDHKAQTAGNDHEHHNGLYIVSCSHRVPVRNTAPNRPNRSKPALQKAEIAVNTLIQMPSSPNCGTKTNSSSRMPMPSNIASQSHHDLQHVFWPARIRLPRRFRPAAADRGSPCAAA